MAKLMLGQLPIRKRVLAMLLFSIMATAASLAAPAKANTFETCEQKCDRKYQCCLDGCQWWNIFCVVACGDDIGGLTYCYTNCGRGQEPFMPEGCTGGGQ
jgi:hypothetical protein